MSPMEYLHLAHIIVVSYTSPTLVEDKHMNHWFNFRYNITKERKWVSSESVTLLVLLSFSLDRTILISYFHPYKLFYYNDIIFLSYVAKLVIINIWVGWHTWWWMHTHLLVILMQLPLYHTLWLYVTSKYFKQNIERGAQNKFGCFDDTGKHVYVTTNKILLFENILVSSTWVIKVPCY